MSNSKEFFPLSPFILNITQLKCLPFTLTLAQTHILEHFSFLYSHAHKLSHGNCPPPCQSDSICCCDPGLGSSEALHLPSSQTLISLSTLPTLPPILSGLFSHHATLPAWKSSFGLFFFFNTSYLHTDLSICFGMLPLLQTFRDKTRGNQIGCDTHIA